MRKTTCLIGHFVWKADASTGGGSEPDTTCPGLVVGVEDSVRLGDEEPVPPLEVC